MMDEDLAARCVAHLDACSDDSLICEMTAGQLHDMWLPPGYAEMDVAVAERDAEGHAMIRSRRAEVRAHRREFESSDVMVLDGVAVTTPEQTWFDLASRLSLPDLVAAGDSVLRAGTDLAVLDALVRRRARRRGVRLAREALALLDARSRSRPESHLRVAASAPDLPRFQVNVPVHRDEGGWLAEPDLSLAAAKIALEYQGDDHATPARMRRDITRSTDMRHERWIVIEYGPAEVFGRPWQIAPELRHLIRSRRPELLGPTPRRRPRRVVVQRPEWSRNERPLSA